MQEDQPPQEVNRSQQPSKPKLYVFGSCQSDQYFHPKHGSESRRPICLTSIEAFSPEGEDSQDEGTQKIPNPLYQAEITKIACGALHTVVATRQGKVYTFGCNDQGALGREGPEKIPKMLEIQDRIDYISAGDNHSAFGSSIGCVVYFTGNYMFQRGGNLNQPIRKPISYTTSEISGRNNYGKLQKLASGSNHTVALIDGRVYVRGQPESFTTGRKILGRHQIENSLRFQGVGLSGIVDLWCGAYHTVAKKKKGHSYEYYGWGINSFGQLSMGGYDNVQEVQKIAKLKGKDIKEMAGGEKFSLFLTEEGEVYGCGANEESQLGLGENYIYFDSDQEQEEKLEQQIEEKMTLKEKPEEQQHLKTKKPQKMEVELVEGLKQGQKPENPNAEDQKQESKDADREEKEGEEKGQPQLDAVPFREPESPVKQLQATDYYIQKIKKVALQKPVNHISAGSNFSYAWNNQNLFTWGMGFSYVLLNGSEQNEYFPFKVKPKIINEETIWRLQAGSQHVAYLSYPSEQEKPSQALSEQARKVAEECRARLSRRRRTHG